MQLTISVGFGNPSESHWKGLKRILRYIQGTINYGLFYSRSNKGNEEILAVYSDADWGNVEDRKSTGFLFKLYGNTICWSTRKQNSVAMSSTEAEYTALAMTASEYLWLKNLLKDFKICFKEPVIFYEDNKSCVDILHKWEHKRLRHVDIKYNFVKDLVKKEEINVK